MMNSTPQSTVMDDEAYANSLCAAPFSSNVPSWHSRIETRAVESGLWRGRRVGGTGSGLGRGNGGGQRQWLRASADNNTPALDALIMLLLTAPPNDSRDDAFAQLSSLPPHTPAADKLVTLAQVNFLVIPLGVPHFPGMFISGQHNAAQGVVKVWIVDCHSVSTIVQVAPSTRFANSCVLLRDDGTCVKFYGGVVPRGTAAAATNLFGGATGATTNIALEAGHCRATMKATASEVPTPTLPPPQCPRVRSFLDLIRLIALHRDPFGATGATMLGRLFGGGKPGSAAHPLTAFPKRISYSATPTTRPLYPAPLLQQVLALGRWSNPPQLLPLSPLPPLFLRLHPLAASSRGVFDEATISSY
ncbi:hypothetical protein M427DRAFT_41454 [Gonapodya prolifera JEL478]|uniref:Uncharacterized protein n=1 Tax=Gonapodya prolifera (strain JEL478) TaxID=1344416 RepID=A0A139ATU9_GONPJ|nr:hypothetical protein M427DRAFT_41454 [Gonapodya prolifera JEL478]|eukprot:KXS20124.1 hypothetical protein M427DRAFT_41454 [Gonapodya prolifera JEL478]